MGRQVSSIRANGLPELFDVVIVSIGSQFNAHIEINGVTISPVERYKNKPGPRVVLASWLVKGGSTVTFSDLEVIKTTY
jgi:hypothetical protein